jgi:hypothetical protein
MLSLVGGEHGSNYYYGEKIGLMTYISIASQI